MLKFFRKIRKNLIDTQDIRKYLLYSIGEILLVMIGILLALQVNNWNERNKAEKEEQKILQSLQTEYSDNIENLEQILASHKTTISRIEDVLKKYKAGNLNTVDSNSLVELRNAVFGKTYDPKFGVLNSLLNSEKINLIENDLLRNRIAKIPGMMEDYSEDEELVVQSIFEFYLPELFRLKPESLNS